MPGWKPVGVGSGREIGRGGRSQTLLGNIPDGLPVPPQLLLGARGLVGGGRHQNDPDSGCWSQN